MHDVAAAAVQRLLRRTRFLDAYSECGIITKAAQAIGVDETTPVRWAKADVKFAEEMEKARDKARHGLLAEAWRRAKFGTSRPVYQKGMLVGFAQEYSDTLMALLLKGFFPETFRERFEGTIKHESDVDLSKLTDEEWDQLKTLMTKAKRGPTIVGASSTMPALAAGGES